MPIVIGGSINAAGQLPPDIYVQVQPPPIAILGTASGRLGLVGTASWGPVNQPAIVGSYQGYTAQFGPLVARAFDMGTHVNIAATQGANDFRCVRVTDGTDTAAGSNITITGQSGASINFYARYTGFFGNYLSVTLGVGSRIGTVKLTVLLAGVGAETFDNIVSGANVWANIVAAVTNGTGPLRGPSQLILAVIGSAPTAPLTGVVLPITSNVAFSGGTFNAFGGGTDGATGVTSATLVGTSATGSAPAKGGYALIGLGCQLLDLCDATDSTQWTTADALAQQLPAYNVAVAPAGAAISNGSNGSADLKATAGLDSFSTKLLHGDWVSWLDNVTNQTRLVSPQPFVAGRLASLSPEQSSLNKQVLGVLGTQRTLAATSATATSYTPAELLALQSAGIDVIANPCPGGSYFGVRLGVTSSSNAATRDDNYPRLTFFLATSFNGTAGKFIGAVIDADLLRAINATFNDFLTSLVGQKVLRRNLDGSLPFHVVCDATNNPQARTALGYVQADINVTYAGINRDFIVNLTGGATVVTTSVTAA